MGEPNNNRILMILYFQIIPYKKSFVNRIFVFYNNYFTSRVLPASVSCHIRLSMSKNRQKASSSKEKAFVLLFKTVRKCSGERVTAFVVAVTVMSLDPNEGHPVFL